jgi:Putative auto-transporter adhesin, head GIN domain
MKTKILSAAFFSILFLSGCGFWGVRGNGHIKQESRDISDFETLEAGGAFTIKVKVGPSPSLRISAEENLLSFIRTRVEGDKLVIDTKKSISPRKEILIEITTSKLTSVDASGANNISVTGISGEEFNADLSGAGHVNLDGEVNSFRAELSGAGSIEARYLKAKDVHVSVSGAANANVFAKDYLDASVSGVGSIDYYGDPLKTKTDVSGVGSITRK